MQWVCMVRFHDACVRIETNVRYCVSDRVQTLVDRAYNSVPTKDLLRKEASRRQGEKPRLQLKRSR